MYNNKIRLVHLIRTNHINSITRIGSTKFHVKAFENSHAIYYNLQFKKKIIN